MVINWTPQNLARIFTRNESIPPERDGPLLDALLGDDPEGDGVAGVDLPLAGRDEQVVHQVNGILQADLLVIRAHHVLLADLVVIQ